MFGVGLLGGLALLGAAYALRRRRR
jgi:hypothetical protein